jgi:hypothetical protein
MRELVMTVTLVMALVSGAEGASAQTAPHGGSPAEQRACSLDTRQHCREAMSQGDMAVLACLQQHRGKLTRGCEAVLRKHGQ